MKTHQYSAQISSFIIASAFLVLLSSSAHAASIPSLSLSSAGGSSVQINVAVVDPAASVVLYYNSATSSSVTAALGLTDSNGSLSTIVSSGTYGVLNSSAVYVSVDGAQSPAAYWPVSTGSSGTLSLSQTVLNIATGQSANITASNASGALSVTNDSNASVAIGTPSGSAVLVTAYNTGTATLTICDASADCQYLTVTVLSASTAGFSLGSTVANLIVGQSQTIALNGLGPFYVSQNSNPAIVSTTINGSSLVLNGTSAGSASVTVCQSNGQCGTVNVSSNPPSGSAPASAPSSGGVIFAPSSLVLAVGQSQTASLSGSATGQYYASGDSAPAVASASLTGNVLQVNGLSSGNASITVCASSSQCGTLSVSVSSGSAAAPSLAVPPILSSMSISSNGAHNAFIGVGTAVTLTFNIDQSVNVPQVKVNGGQVAVNGSGSGPYTAVYTVTGSESQPIPVSVYFTGTTGSGQAYLWLGNYSAMPGSVSSPVTSGSSAASYSFTRYLYIGMTALGVADPDVTALQERLAADGLYSGPVTGYFGPLTKAAVEAYQTKHSLSAIGVVGPGTRELLDQGI